MFSPSVIDIKPSELHKVKFTLQSTKNLPLFLLAVKYFVSNENMGYHFKIDVLENVDNHQKFPHREGNETD